MATSEPLVPKNLPKGSRTQVRDGMQRAGIPLAPRGGSPRGSGPGAPSSPSGAPPLGLDLASLSPDDFPFLQDQPPAVDEPASGQSAVAALTASAQSEFAQAVLARLAGKSG